MICKLTVFTILVVGCIAQRSPYVPRPVDYPGLHPRFGTSEPSANVDNRFGAPSSNLPGSLYDDKMVQHVSTWPKEKQPFWYLNSAQIAAHRGYQQNQQAQPANSRSQ